MYGLYDEYEDSIRNDTLAAQMRRAKREEDEIIACFAVFCGLVGGATVLFILSKLIKFISS